MLLYALMITQGTHGFSSFVKSLTFTILEAYANVCIVRIENKLVRLFVFIVIMEENLKAQSSQNYVLLKV